MRSRALRRTRMAGALVLGVVLAAALGAGVGAMTDALAGAPKPPTTAPSPAAPAPTATSIVGSELPSPAPSPVLPSPPAPSLSPAAVVKPAYLNMGDVAPWRGKGQSITIPAGVRNCPAATVQIGAELRVDVGGVEYGIYGDSAVGYTDMDGDGRIDEVLVLSCTGARATGQVLLVIEATGPSTYATTAARDVSSVRIGAIRAKDGVVTTFSTAYPVELSEEVRTFALRAGKLVQTGVSGKPVDWQNATVTAPAIAACRAGAHALVNGTAALDGDRAVRVPAGALAFHTDFDGDGVRDSILQLDCVENGEVTGSAVVALSPTGGRTGRVLAVVADVQASAAERIEGYHLANGVVGVAISHLDPTTKTRVTRNVDYRWAGDGFARAA